MKMVTMRLITLLIIVSSSNLLAQQPAGIPEFPTDISPLLIGETIPGMNLKTVDGITISILEKIAKKKSVLIFYRGGWCPYCNNHLAEIQTIENEILDAGFQILAISPDAPEQLSSSAEKQELTYELLSDADMQFSIAMGIAFQANSRSKNRLFRVSDGLNAGLLPVPSVFVVGRDGVILFEYINPDYKQRMPGSMLLTVLRTLIDEE
jgi:peroxiredoxin